MSKEILAPGTIEPYNKKIKNIELETGENWPLKILVCSPGTPQAQAEIQSKPKKWSKFKASEKMFSFTDAKI